MKSYLATVGFAEKPLGQLATDRLFYGRGVGGNVTNNSLHNNDRNDSRESDEEDQDRSEN
jgi:hypothetical protein